MITLSDQIYLSLLLPLDTRLSNVLIDGNTVVVENFNDYFTRVDLGSRYLGMEVNILSPFGVYEINTFLNKVQNKEFTSSKYRFSESILDSYLVEITGEMNLVDSELSLTSTNPVENRKITEVINDLYSKVGESEIIEVSDSPIYNPTKVGGYLAGDFVSYINLSSPDPKYQTYAIYLAQENIPMDQSPEVNSNWEWQGTELEISNRNTSMIMVNNIDAIEKITGYKQSDGIIDKSTGILYRYNQTSMLLPSLLTIRPLDKEESDPGRWIAQMFLKQSEKFNLIQISHVDYVEVGPEWDYHTTISFSDLVFGDLTLYLLIQNPLIANIQNHMTICIDNRFNAESIHLNFPTSWTINWKGNSPLATIPGGKNCFIKIDSLQNNNYLIEYDFINDLKINGHFIKFEDQSLPVRNTLHFQGGLSVVDDPANNQTIVSTPNWVVSHIDSALTQTVNAQPYTIYIIDATESPVRVNLPESGLSNREYRIVLEKNTHKVTISTESENTFIRNYYSQIIPTVGGMMYLKENLDHYDVITDTTGTQHVEILNESREFLTDGIEHNILYLCDPQGESHVHTLPNPTYIPGSKALRAEFLLISPGTVIIQSPGNVIGDRQDQVLNLVGTSFVIVETNNKYYLNNDTRPKVVNTSISTYPVRHDSDVIDPLTGTFFKQRVLSIDDDRLDQNTTFEASTLITAEPLDNFQLFGSSIQDVGVISGLLPEGNIEIFWNLRRTGNRDCLVYASYYIKHNGSETLIGTSNQTTINSDIIHTYRLVASHEQINVLPTDRLVVRIFARKTGVGGTCNLFQQVEGPNPSRSVIDVSISALNHNAFSGRSATNCHPASAISMNSGETTELAVTELYRITRGARKIIYVRSNASGLNNGTSWTNAYTRLYPALVEAKSGDEVWIAGGTYDLSENGLVNPLTLKPGSKTYGGFVGTETGLGDRVLGVSETIITGVQGGSKANRLLRIGLGGGTVLDGVTLENYLATDASGGHALYVDNCNDVVIRNIKIRGGRVVGNILGSAVRFFNANALVNNLEIDDCIAGGTQGISSIYCGGCNLMMDKITIKNCSATIASGISLRRGNYRINNYTADNNTEGTNSYYGSGILLSSNIAEPNKVNLVITNSRFINCYNQFGIFHINQSSNCEVIAANLVFENCRSPNAVVDVWPGAGSNVTLVNCTYKDNNSGLLSYDVNVEATTAGNVYILNSISTGGPRSIGVEASITGDVQIRKCKLSSGVYKSTNPSIEDYITGSTTFGDNYEPIEQDCYRSGDLSLYDYKKVGLLDYRGLPRAIGNKIDLGAVSIANKDLGGVTTHSELTGKDDEADFQHITSTEKTNLTDHINGANEAKHGAEQIVLVSEETVQSAIERIDNKDTSDLPLSTPLLGANNQDEYNVANESDKDAIKAQLAVNQLTFSSIYGYNNFI